MLAALLVLVLVLMQQAQKAENFHWLWYLQGQAIPNGQMAEDVDTRVRDADPQAGSSSELGPIIQGAPPGGQRAALPTASDDAPIELTPLDQARFDAWSVLLDALDQEDRRQLLLGVKLARDGQALVEEARSSWPARVQELDEGWRQYVAEARQALDEAEPPLSDDERRQWTTVLDDLAAQWQQQSLPALSALANTEPLPPEQQTTLDEIQTVWDAVFLSAIQDNTVFRAAEMDAWYRLLERLARRNEAELERASAPTVSFGQLFKQPEVYRGRLVTVLGRVRRAEFMQAPENLYGIDSYYRLWLQPVASNSPIVIYSLEVPDGFPAPRTLARGPHVDLDEDVRITGYFFKRWPYPAQDGTRLAPVLLSKTFAWSPGNTSLTDPANLPPSSFWIALFAGTGLFGIVVAVLVYWISARSTPLALRRRLTSATKKGPPS